MDRRNEDMGRSCHSPERERLHQSFMEDKYYLEKMIDHNKEKRNERIGTILELKQNIELSASKIQENNAFKAQQEKEREEQESKEFQELLNQGKNPYEIFRSRQIKKDAEKQRRKLEKNIEDKQVSIMKHLSNEKAYQERLEKAEKEKQAYEKKYQKELGRSVVEKRTKEYMLSRTGQETVDPTGKMFRIYPSQVTTIKDHSFGLGKNLVHTEEQRARVINKVQAKPFHKDAEPISLLLPRWKSTSSIPDSPPSRSGNNMDTESFFPESVQTPGKDLKDLNHSFNGNSGTTLPPLNRTDSFPNPSAPTTGTKKGFGVPKRSILEQRMLQTALEKQKTNIFQKQIVWGKEFKGTAFLSEPAQLLFKDFDIGVTQTIHFELTNVSNTFNHFKLLDLPDEIQHLFEIRYERPGRMSAGMSCKLKITFTPRSNLDIETELPALAQTGAFGIPLRCTSKKALPSLQQREIVFSEVIVGETKTQTITLVNNGALPIDFTVTRLEPTIPEETQALDHDDTHEENENMGEAGLDSKESNVLTSARPTTSETRTPGHSRPATREANDSTIPQSSSRPQSQQRNSTTEQGEIHQVESTLSVESSGDNSITVENSAEQERDFPVLMNEENLLMERQFLHHAKSFAVFKASSSSSDCIHHTKQGTLQGYSTHAISFTFAPTEPQNVQQTFAIMFSDSMLSPILVHVEGKSGQVPIFVEQEVLDFRCCAYNKLYRHKLFLRNRGKVALKVQLKVPKPLEGCVEFHPNFGYAQGLDSKNEPGRFEIQVKFCPTEKMWKRIEKKRFGSQELGMIAVPVQVLVPDQVVPVFVVLQARLTPIDLLFSMKQVDFGECPFGQGVTQTLVIENASRLPQRFGFMKIPSEITVEPNDGFGTLLPNERVQMIVTYNPFAAKTSLNSKMVCQTSANQEYVIPVVGNCVSFPLAFSHTVLRLGATALGQHQIVSVSCENQSTDKYIQVELLVPPEAEKFLKVTPLVATVAPKKSIRVEVEFTPTHDIFELKQAIYEGMSEKGSVLNSIQGSFSQDNEEKSSHHTWTILCFRRELDQDQITSSSTKTIVKTTTNSLPFLGFQVFTTTIEPKLVSIPEKIDFGQVATGQCLMKEVTLKNISSLTLPVKMKPLHALGSFRLVNTLRPVPPNGGMKRLLVEFKPSSQMFYEEELLLQSPCGSLSIPLIGQGINPSLEITPRDGILDFKDILARNKSTLDLTLTNSSFFPLTFKIVSLDPYEKLHISANNMPTFMCSPNEATIPAKESITVKVTFSPDRQRPEHYCSHFRVQVPNESEEHVLVVKGRCWENQIFFCYDDKKKSGHQENSSSTTTVRQSQVVSNSTHTSTTQLPLVEDVFDIPPNITLPSSLTSMLEKVLKKPPSHIGITFDDGELLKNFIIGCTQPPSGEDEYKGSTNGSFELALDPSNEKYHKIFLIEPMKGSLNPGQQIQVKLELQSQLPPSSSSSSEASRFEDKHPELRVPHWVEAGVICTLRGGFMWRPADTRIIRITLRAKLFT